MAAETAPEPRTADGIDRQVATSIRALVAARQITPEEMARALNMTKRTYYRRLADGGWRASEVGLLADYFGVSVSDVFEGRLLVICGLTASGEGSPKGAPVGRERRRRQRRRSDRWRPRLLYGDGPDDSAIQSPLLAPVRSQDRAAV